MSGSHEGGQTLRAAPESTMIEVLASGSAFKMVTGETLKGAKQTVLTPGGEDQSWGLSELSEGSSQVSSSLMLCTPLPPLPL
eukprot:7573600-Alexandrium_andersonii.AAC.1